MHVRLLPAALIAAAAFPLVAQGPVISPIGAGYATKKGNSVMQYPFSKGNGKHRWQQSHGELKAKPLAIKSLAWRQGGFNSRTALARKVTCELWMGAGDYAKLSRTFARNWIGAPTKVMASKVVNVPSFASAPPGGWPAPFNVVVPLDRPYPHSGANGLTWELRVSAIDFQDWTYFDYHRYSPDNRSRQRRIGTGCRASTTPANLPRHYMDSYLVANFDRKQYSFQWRSWWGVKSASTTILLGVKEVDVPVPGLCTNVYVDGIVGTIDGTAPSSGHWTNTPRFTFPYDPGWVGFKIYSQTVALDPNQRGGTIPVCLSRGEENTIPALGAAPFAVSAVHANGSNTATSGNLYKGSALVTEFK